MRQQDKSLNQKLLNTVLLNVYLHTFVILYLIDLYKHLWQISFLIIYIIVIKTKKDNYFMISLIIIFSSIKIYFFISLIHSRGN